VRVCILEGVHGPFELPHRFFIEPDVIEVLGGDTGFPETVADGLDRETGVMLFPGETFLFGGGDQLAILEQGGGGVMIEAGNAQDIHGSFPG
jgi:hypothetical protein